MNTNPFWEHSIYQFVDGTPGPDPAPDSDPIRSRAPAPAPATKAEGAATATPPGVTGISTPHKSESHVQISADISQQDLNGSQPSTPASASASGRATYQLSQRRGNMKRPPVPQFSLTENFDISMSEHPPDPTPRPLPSGMASKTDKRGGPGNPLWWAPPSILKFKSPLWPFIILANLPFLSMFLMDIIGTCFPRSQFYNKHLNLRRWTAGPILFQFFYIVIGLCTAVANILFLGTFIGWVNRRWQKDPEARLLGRHSLYATGTVVLVFGMLAVALATIAGPIAAPFVAIKMHTTLWENPLSTTCEELGFATTIMLRAVDSGGGRKFPEGPIFSNATFFSATESPLTMILVPHTDPNLQNTTSFFVFDPTGVNDTDILLLKVQNISVSFDLSQHTYEFRFSNGRTPEMVDLDIMVDDPNNPDSLAFPNLPYRVHSTSNYGWASSLDPTSLQPWVDFRQYLSHPWVLLLKTETDHPPGYLGCATVRMCGLHSLDEMLRDGDKLESTVVPVGRFLIELARFGSRFC